MGGGECSALPEPALPTCTAVQTAAEDGEADVGDVTVHRRHHDSSLLLVLRLSAAAGVSALGVFTLVVPYGKAFIPAESQGIMIWGGKCLAQGVCSVYGHCLLPAQPLWLGWPGSGGLGGRRQDLSCTLERLILTHNQRFCFSHYVVSSGAQSSFV